MARSRLRAALGWARKVVLRARVRQMLARRVVRTATAVDTIHSLQGSQHDAAAATAATTTTAMGPKKKPALRNTAQAGVRVLALVRSCEQQPTRVRGAAIANTIGRTNAENGICLQ